MLEGRHSSLRAAARHVVPAAILATLAVLSARAAWIWVERALWIAAGGAAGLAVAAARRRPPGEPGTNIPFAVDLTEQKRLEQALRAGEARLRRLRESNIIGVLHSDASGNIIDANDFVLRMLGYTRDDLLAGHVSWSEVTPAAYLPLDERGIAEARERGACTPYEKVFVGKGGRTVPVLLGYALLEGSRSEFICFVLDLTEQKRAEEQARAAAEREMLLESERAARGEVERACRAKDEFVATLSHELRTPLSAIIGWAELARRPRQGPEQVEKALGIVERNARALTQIIADLLDVSRIVSGKMRVDLVPVDLGAVTAAAIDGVRAAAEAKGIALVLTLARDLVVLGDASRLQQVVWNLVTNAIKFTPPGGRVEVSLAEREGGFELAVCDSGDGIDPAFLPHLFERFRQAEASASRRHGGLGLGLSIVKHLVEIHGGVVRAESDGLGRGARFTIALPAGPGCGARAPTAAEPLPCRLAGARILVVDDEPDAQELVRRLLEERGAAVVTASSAAEALDVIAGQPLDALVSDIGMPGMDGYELMRRVRAGRASAGVPAVALTAYARPEDRARALCAGYQAHLAKPVEPAEMLATVSGLVQRGAAA